MGRRIVCARVTRPPAPPAGLALAARARLRRLRRRDRAWRRTTRPARGAELFYERCSGCHTLEAANSYGSKPEGELAGGERTNGPNFNVRKESRDDVLFAIRNGGFSGAIMPANIVVGEDAEAVADFLAEYSGSGSASSGDIVSARPKAIREDPDARTRPRSPARGRRREGRPSCSSWTRAAGSCSRRSRRSAPTQEHRQQADRRAPAERARTRRRRSPRSSELGEREKELEQRAARGGASSSTRRSRPRCRTCRIADAPDEDTVLREVGEAGASGPDHLELLGESDRPRGGRARGRLALRLPQGVARAARAGARALGARGARREGLRARWCRRCSCARRRCSAPASCPTPSSRSTRCPRTTSTWRARARCRWPRCTPTRSSTRPSSRCATPASPPASAARRARRARTRAGSSACTSSTRSRCSRSSRPRTRRTEHERLLAIEEELLQALEIPYRVVNIAVERPGRLGGQEVRPRGVAAGAGALPRAHLVLEHHRLPGAPAGRALPRAGEGVEPVHTLNGTAVAVGRTIIAIAENHGGEVPDVLTRFGAPPRLVA